MPGRMLRSILILVLATFALVGATAKLYLKDGSYHLVREYKVESDRVSYYSLERSQWEEIPLDLVDLPRTEREIKERQATIEEKAKAIQAEEDADRKQRRERERIPVEPGVYQVVDGKVRTYKTAEVKIQSSKKRTILSMITPVPIVTGKSTVEVDGAHSANEVGDPLPEFYFRLTSAERFGIVHLKAKGNARLVQTWTVIPVSKQIIEEQEDVEVFRQQLADDLYKIWPSKPLAPGEYAVVEYTPEKQNIQVWDFRCQPAPQAAQK